MRWCSSVLASIGDQCTMQQGLTFFEGGVFTDKTGLKIFVFINAMIFAFTTFVTNTPLYGKIASKVWKIYFQYISPHFLDAAGSQISDLWLLLLSNSSLFSALMSHLPLLLLHNALAGLNTDVKYECSWLPNSSDYGFGDIFIVNFQLCHTWERAVVRARIQSRSRLKCWCIVLLDTLLLSPFQS